MISVRLTYSIFGTGFDRIFVWMKHFILLIREEASRTKLYMTVLHCYKHGLQTTKLSQIEEWGPLWRKRCRRRWSGACVPCTQKTETGCQRADSSVEIQWGHARRVRASYKKLHELLTECQEEPARYGHRYGGSGTWIRRRPAVATDSPGQVITRVRYVLRGPCSLIDLAEQ